MAKANPKKWFPSRFTAQISFRKVDKWAEYSKERKPYFDTWDAAHAQATAWATQAIERAKKDAEAAKRAIKSADIRAKKVAALKPPSTTPQEQ